MIEREIQELANQKVYEVYALAEQKFHRSFARPKIVWDLKGRTAGIARYFGLNDHRNAIRLNFDVLNANVEDFINDTIPHEVSHMIVFDIYGTNIKPHGCEWKRIATELGSSGNRCHVNETIPARITQKFKWKCSCMTHTVGLNLHRKMLSGRGRICLKCRGTLTYSI